jgi:hypothetical protein
MQLCLEGIAECLWCHESSFSKGMSWRRTCSILPSHIDSAMSMCCNFRQEREIQLRLPTSQLGWQVVKTQARLACSDVARRHDMSVGPPRAGLEVLVVSRVVLQQLPHCPDARIRQLAAGQSIPQSATSSCPWEPQASLISSTAWHIGKRVPPELGQLGRLPLDIAPQVRLHPRQGQVQHAPPLITAQHVLSRRR